MAVSTAAGLALCSFHSMLHGCSAVAPEWGELAQPLGWEVRCSIAQLGHPRCWHCQMQCSLLEFCLCDLVGERGCAAGLKGRSGTVRFERAGMGSSRPGFQLGWPHQRTLQLYGCWGQRGVSWLCGQGMGKSRTCCPVLKSAQITQCPDCCFESWLRGGAQRGAGSAEGLLKGPLELKGLYFFLLLYDLLLL